MPSGRDYPSQKSFVPPVLEEEAIIRMRAPPDPGDTAFKGEEDDSADDEERVGSAPGAFPVAGAEHSAGTSYY